MICAKAKPAVSGLETEFPGKVVAKNVDATSADGKKDVEGLGFKSHGLVVRSADGEVLFKQADHTVDMEKVRAKLKELLGS
jgi:hypothetical protein